MKLPDDLRSALAIVLELAEENALEDDDVEADPSLRNAQMEQMQACKLVRELIGKANANANVHTNGVTHVMLSMGLALSDVQFQNGTLSSGHVVNGHWTLLRNGNNWIINGKEVPIKIEDLQLAIIPAIYCNDYNAAINYAERKQCQS